MIEKKVKKITDFPKNEINPFIEEASLAIKKNVEVKRVTSIPGKQTETFANVEDGSIAHGVFMTYKRVDVEQFTKIYVGSLQQLCQLTTAGVRVLSYVLSQLKVSSDRFEFSLINCMKFTHYSSKASVYKGLIELVNAGLIARGYNEYVWFVNPTFFFNGSRITLMQTYELMEENEENSKHLTKTEELQEIAEKRQINIPFEENPEQFNESSMDALALL